MDVVRHDDPGDEICMFLVDYIEEHHFQMRCVVTVGKDGTTIRHIRCDQGRKAMAIESAPDAHPGSGFSLTPG